MARKCKFNYKIKCGWQRQCEKCEVFKQTGQQLLAPPKPKPKKIVRRKGHTTYYYELEAGRRKK